MIKYKKNDKGLLLPFYIEKKDNNFSFFSFFKSLSSTLKDIVYISIIFGIIYGFFISFNYLNKINYLFLFSDIISTPSSFIGLLLFPILIFIFILLLFSLQFLTNSLIFTSFNLSKLTYEKNEYLFFIPIFHLFFSLWFFIILFFNLSIHGFNKNSTLIIFFINYLLINIILLLSLSNKEINELAKIFLRSFIAKFFIAFILFFSILVVSIKAKDDLSQWGSFIALLIAIFLIELFSCIEIKRNSSKINLSYFIPAIVMTFYIVILIIYQFFIDIQSVSLYTLKYIEKPQDSSWYLIHNGNTTSDTINGMTKDDIRQRKEMEFNAKDCAKYLGNTDEGKGKCKTDNNQLNERPNALYGYMAWNLGNTKVFCPQSVDFFKTNNQDERNKMSQKCLVIDGKYLQLISAEFLAQK